MIGQAALLLIYSISPAAQWPLLSTVLWCGEAGSRAAVMSVRHAAAHSALVSCTAHHSAVRARRVCCSNSVTAAASATTSVHTNHTHNTTQTKYMETLTRTTKHHRVTASWQQAYVHVSRKSCYNLMTDYLFITTKMHLRCTIISYKCLHYNVFLKISTSVTFPKFPFQANKVYLYCLGHVKHYCDYD